MQERKIKLITLRSVILTLALLSATATANEVNLYTDRQEVFLRPLLQAFEEETGIKTNVLFAKSGLLERMRAEGDRSPADVVMAVDSGRLDDFARAGLLARHNDNALRTAVPPGLRDDYWVGVTRRARILYVGKETVIQSYQDLAAPENAGKVCIRSGTHLYNIGLFADFISRWGENATKQWLADVKNNLAQRPQGNDRAQINGVANGDCGVGVANSYYYFQMARDSEKKKWLEETVRVVVPQQAHINVTGAGLAAHAPHRDNALLLMRFLVGKRAQEIYATQNKEFPVRDDVPFPPELSPFRAALKNAAPLADISRHRATASRLVEEVGFNR